MKRHVTTIVLLLIAIGLGVFLYRDRNKVTEGERQKRENNIFTAWRRDDLSRIEIVHDGETIVIIKDTTKPESSWRMTSPSDERVDQAAVERLITTLEFATRVRKVSDDANLGLDSPRARGSITMGTIVMKWALGNPSPRPEGSSYFKVEADTAASAPPPFVVSKELTESLLAHADSLRDRTVIPYLSLEMQRFEVKVPGGAAGQSGFAVVRKDERSFTLEGSGLLASRVALDKVWGALAEMRAEAFPKNADADRLTQNVRLSITMISKDGGKPPGELVVGDACPDHPNDVVVLRRQPTRVAACAPKGALETLLAITPDHLLDRRPFSFRHDEIEELRLQGSSATTIELARRGTGFHQREPEDRELTKDEAEAASDLLIRIEHGEATDVRPGAAASPFKSIATAKVRAGAHEETIEVGEITKDAVTLRRLHDDARLTVPASVARRLIPRKMTTTKPHVLVTDTRQVKRLVLRCGGQPQDFADEGAGLKLTSPKGYETDGQITQLVDAIFRGKVIAWVADEDDGSSFGFKKTDADDCRIVVAFEDANSPLTIRLGGEGEGGFYGMIDGRPEVFVATRAFHDLASRIYVSRAALRPDPAKIESVKMTIGGKPVVLRENVREKMGSFYADRTLSIGNKETISNPADVEITVAMSEGGPPLRIACSKPEGVWRKCATPTVKAIFAVATAMIDGLQPTTTSSAATTDAGSR